MVKKLDVVGEEELTVNYLPLRYYDSNNVSLLLGDWKSNTHTHQAVRHKNKPVFLLLFFFFLISAACFFLKPSLNSKSGVFYVTKFRFWLQNWILHMLPQLYHDQSKYSSNDDEIIQLSYRVQK